MDRLEEQRLITKQLATVRMIQSENQRELQGNLPRIDFREWSKWLDISMDEILQIQEMCQSMEQFELCNNAICGCVLETEGRKSAFKYLNTYGRAICRMATILGEDRTKDFIENSINAFSHRIIQEEHLKTDVSKLRKDIYTAATQYFVVFTEAAKNIFHSGYSPEVVKEIYGNN